MRAFQAADAAARRATWWRASSTAPSPSSRAAARRRRRADGTSGLRRLALFQMALQASTRHVLVLDPDVRPGSGCCRRSPTPPSFPPAAACSASRLARPRRCDHRGNADDVGRDDDDGGAYLAVPDATLGVHARLLEVDALRGAWFLRADHLHRPASPRAAPTTAAADGATTAGSADLADRLGVGAAAAPRGPAVARRARRRARPQHVGRPARRPAAADRRTAPRLPRLGAAHAAATRRCRGAPPPPPPPPPSRPPSRAAAANPRAHSRRRGRPARRRVGRRCCCCCATPATRRRSAHCTSHFATPPRSTSSNGRPRRRWRRRGGGCAAVMAAVWERRRVRARRRCTNRRRRRRPAAASEAVCAGLSIELDELLRATRAAIVLPRAAAAAAADDAASEAAREARRRTACSRW